MRKILIILVISFSSTIVNSQVISTKYDTRVHLTQDEHNYEHYKSEFEKADKTMKVGMGITLAGVAFTGIGLVIVFSSQSWDGMYAGAAMFLIGGIMAVTGTPIWIAGGVRRHNNKIAMRKAKTELSFGSTKNGIGLTLSF